MKKEERTSAPLFLLCRRGLLQRAQGRDRGERVAKLREQRGGESKLQVIRDLPRDRRRQRADCDRKRRRTVHGLQQVEPVEHDRELLARGKQAGAGAVQHALFRGLGPRLLGIVAGRLRLQLL